MDISAVNFNFNAVNRAVFSAADNTDETDTAPAREKRNRTGVVQNSVENLLPPTQAVEEIMPDSAQTHRHGPEGRLTHHHHNDGVDLTV